MLYIYNYQKEFNLQQRNYIKNPCEPTNSSITYGKMKKAQFCYENILNISTYANIRYFNFIGNFNKIQCLNNMGLLYNNKNNCNNTKICYNIEIPNYFKTIYNKKIEVILNFSNLYRLNLIYIL